MIRKFFAVLLSTLLVATGLVAAEVAAPQVAQADYATDTSRGKYSKQIFWIDWSQAKNADDSPIGAALTETGAVATGNSKQVLNGTYVEVEPIPGYKIRATVSGITAKNVNTGSTASTANPVWATVQNANYSDLQARTNGVIYGYSTGTQLSRLAPRRNGLGLNFDLTFQVYRNGVLVPSEYPDVIAADGENLNSNENILFTTTGDAWKNIENVGYVEGSKGMWLEKNSVSNGGFGTKTFGTLTSASKAVPLGVTAKTPKVNVQINTTGAEDVVLGFITSVDQGDAPSSYGTAGHVLPWSTTGSPRSTDVNDQPRVVLNSSSAPYLGANPPDAEGNASETAWIGDDSEGDYNGTKQADEKLTDLVQAGQLMPAACGASEYYLTINTKNASSATVAGWIDFNNNGVFEDSERAQATPANDKATLRWTGVPQLTGGSTLGSRFRIATLGSDVLSPTGLAGTGEVEDHQLTVLKCGLSVDKAASPTTVTYGSNTVTYTFTVKNTGEIPLTSVTLKDAQLSASTIPVADTLAPNESKTVTQTYVVENSRIEQGGQIVNTATASGKGSGNSSSSSADDKVVTSPQAQATVTVDYAPHLTVTKSLDETNPNNDSLLTYSIVVTNDGNVPLTNVQVDDPKIGGLLTVRGGSQTSVNLAARGGQAVFVGSKTITQEDRDAGGKFVNTATATGTAPNGTTLTGHDSAETPFTAAPGVKITKTGPASISADGTQIEYGFEVENTGNVSLTKLAFSDPLLGITNSTVYEANSTDVVGTKLVPGERYSFTRTYSVAQADRERGFVDNNATVTGTPITGGSTPGTSNTVRTTIPQDPQLALVKSFTVDHSAHGTGPAGIIDSSKDVVVYSFEVENTGNLTVRDFRFTDALLGIDYSPQTLTVAGTSGATQLKPGEKGTFTASYRVTQENIDSDVQDIKNVASITGTPVTSVPGVEPPSVTSNTTITPIVDEPKYSVTKELLGAESGGTYGTPQPDALRVVGDIVNYKIVATNEGNVALTGLTYSDALVRIKDAPFPGQPLAPGASTEVYVSHTVTQADVDAGKVSNVATAKHPTAGPETTPTVTVPTDSTSEITLKKTGALVIARQDGAAAVGDRIDYTLEATNTGTTTLTNPRISDDLLGLSVVSCVPAGHSASGTVELAPGDSCIVTGIHVLTQADVDARKVVNTADVLATSPSGTDVTDDDSATVPTVGAPNIDVIKSAPNLVGSVAGDKLTYTFTVKNTGTVTLSDVRVRDTKYHATNALAVTPGTLAPGETGTASFQYTLTQADLNTGSVTNTASATSGVPTGYTPPLDNDSKTSTVTGTAKLSVIKAAVTDGTVDTVGDRITYTITVKNTGSVAVSGLTVSDPMYHATNTLTVSPSRLEPGQSGTATFVHAVTQGDLDAGNIRNTATATGTPVTPGVTLQPTPSNPVDVPTAGNPALAIAKELVAGTAPTKAGDKVTFKLTVTNTGHTTLTGVTAADMVAGVGSVTLASRTLAVGASTTGTVTYAVTQADIDRGYFTNIATADATSSNKVPVPQATSNEVTVTFPAIPQWTITKTSNNPQLTAVGNTVTYTIAVKNTGNVTVNNLTVVDPTASVQAHAPFSLAPGAVKTLTATQQVTQADLDSGKITNTASAPGTPERGTTPDPVPSVTVTDPVVGTPDFTASKTVRPVAGVVPTAEGDVLEYTFTMTNTGNVVLNQALITDPMLDMVNVDALVGTPYASGLKPGETVTLTRRIEVTQAQVDAGIAINNATVTVIPPAHLTPPAPEPVTSEQPISGTSSIKLVKSGESKTSEVLSKAGQKIAYILEVTNTGTTTLLAPKVTDLKLGIAQATPMIDGVPVQSLAPGEVAYIEADWTITQAEVDAGLVHNTAKVTANPPSGPATTVTDTDTEDVPVVGVSTFSVDKSHKVVSGDAITTAGQKVRYSIKVTNTGTTTLTNATVQDPMAGPDPLTVVPSSLAPGYSGVATFDYVVTAADTDWGSIDNTAEAMATPLGGTTPLDPQQSTDTVTIDPAPDITITKKGVAREGAASAEGHIIEYTFVVTNTGNVTLNDVMFSDSRLGIAGRDLGSLAPGQLHEFTEPYALKQADVDTADKKLENTATVTGTPVRGSEVNDSATDVTTLNSTSGYTVTKTAVVLDAQGNPATSNQAQEADQIVRYTITVFNVGTTTIYNPVVRDDMFVTSGNPEGIVPVDGGATEIAPGAKVQATFDYIVTQQDVDDARRIENIATATVDGPDGEPVADPPTPTNKVEIPVIGGSALAIEKSAVGAPVKKGDLVIYYFDVTNTGSVTLNNVGVDDPGLTGLSPEKPVRDPESTDPVELLPGKTQRFKGTYAVTQEDVDAGEVRNIAKASGTRADNSEKQTSPDSNEVILPLPRNGSMKVTKTATPASAPLTAADDLVEYTVTVKNTGNTTLHNVVVKDPRIGSTDYVPMAPPELAPGATATHTFPAYKLTQADVDAGLIENVAQARATTPDNENITDPSNKVVVPIDGTVDLEVTKELINPVPTLVTAAGEELTYRITVTNTGTRTVRNPEITDQKISPDPISLDEVTLTPGDSADVEVTYVITQDDVDAGKVTNVASAVATPVGDSTPSVPVPSNEVNVGINGTADFTVRKVRTSTDTPTAAGEVITYDVVITNTGTQRLHSVTVDDEGSDEKLVELAKPLDPGGVVTVKLTHTVTQADVDAGGYSNTAIVRATPPATSDNPTPEVIPHDDTEVTPIVGSADFSLTKTASTRGALTKAGEIVTYTVVIKNTGTTTLTNPTANDPMFGPDDHVVRTGDLLPGDSATWKFTHAITQDEVDARTVNNTVTGYATRKLHTDPLPSKQASTATPIEPKVALSIVKSSKVLAPAGLVRAGDLVEYTFEVTNTGTTTLYNPTISDPTIGLTDQALPVTTLGVGDSTTFTKEFAITQDHVNAGEIVNTATATATTYGDPTPLPPTSSNTVDNPIASVTAFEVEKEWTSKDATQLKREGQVIVYTLRVRNTGTTTLTAPTVSDPLLDVTDEPVTPQVLEPGESGSIEREYTLTQDDVDNGKVVNTATGTAVPPGTTVPLTPQESPEITTPIGGVPAITVIKGVELPDPDKTSAAGDTLKYWVDVTNDGSVTLTDVQVQDPLISSAWAAVGDGTLAPGKTKRVEFTYVLTQDDVDAGQVVNTARAKGSPPNGAPVVENPSNPVIVGLNGKPGVSVAKDRTSTAIPAKVGDVITYAITVRNTGTLTLEDFTVEDAGSDEKSINVKGPLAPGASTTVEVKHTVTQADLDAGSYRNTAHVANVPGLDIPEPGTDPAPGNDPESNPVDTPISQLPQLSVSKSAASGTIKAVGDEITFTVTVTNTGNVTLRDVTVNDPMYSDQDVSVSDGSLAPGESVDWSFVYKVTQADLDAGTVRNIATASANPPGNLPPETGTLTSKITSNETVTEIVQDSSIKMTKTAEVKPVSADQINIIYTLTVTNTGSTTLTNATVSDPKLGVLDYPLERSTLAPGESASAQFTYEVTAAEIAAGQVANVASGEAQTPSGHLVGGSSSKVITKVELPKTGASVVGISAAALTLIIGGFYVVSRRKNRVTEA